MIQLRVLSGKMAGETIFVRRFPFRIGRAPHNELRLDDDGVWDEHLNLAFQKKAGFTLVGLSIVLVIVGLLIGGILVGKSMIESLLPSHRKARLWDLYLQHHGAIREDAQEDFHTVFGKAFLAAYEQQVAQLKAKRKP